MLWLNRGGANQCILYAQRVRGEVLCRIAVVGCSSTLSRDVSGIEDRRMKMFPDSTEFRPLPIFFLALWQVFAVSVAAAPGEAPSVALSGIASEDPVYFLPDDTVPLPEQMARLMTRSSLATDPRFSRSHALLQQAIIAGDAVSARDSVAALAATVGLADERHYFHLQVDREIARWMETGDQALLQQVVNACLGDDRPPGCRYSLSVAIFVSLETERLARADVMLKAYRAEALSVDNLPAFVVATNVHTWVAATLGNMKLADALQRENYALITGDVLRSSQTRASRLRNMQLAGMSGPSISSEIKIRELLNVALHFALRGDSVPRLVDDLGLARQRSRFFSQALAAAESAIEIAESTSSGDQAAIIMPLRRLAYIDQMRDPSSEKAERAMERVRQVILDHPDSTTPDRVRAMIELADVYIISGDSRSTALYESAWQLMQTDVSLKPLSATLFKLPLQLVPESGRPQVISFFRLPDVLKTAQSVELFADFVLRIKKNGKVARVRALDSNLPHNVVRATRIRLSNYVYRPRMEDGSVVSTSDFLFRSDFSAAR